MTVVGCEKVHMKSFFAIYTTINSFFQNPPHYTKEAVDILLLFIFDQHGIVVFNCTHHIVWYIVVVVKNATIQDGTVI